MNRIIITGNELVRFEGNTVNNITESPEEVTRLINETIMLAVKGVERGNGPKAKDNKTTKGHTKATSQKFIKEPTGKKIAVLGDATVEYFDKDPGTVWGNIRPKIAPGAVKAFNTGGKRYVAGFDRTGKFMGYLLSTDMRTEYISPGTVEGMMADKPTSDALKNAAKLTGIDIQDLETIAMIESTGIRTVHHGLMQLLKDGLAGVNKDEKTDVSLESVNTDVNVNALEGAKYMKLVTKQIENNGYTNPTLADRYLAYQQGPKAFYSLMDNLKNAPDTIITKAQYDNLPSDKRAKTYSVETMTQKQFYEYWTKRIAGIQSQVKTYNNKK